MKSLKTIFRQKATSKRMSAMLLHSDKYYKLLPVSTIASKIREAAEQTLRRRIP